MKDTTTNSHPFAAAAANITEIRRAEVQRILEVKAREKLARYTVTHRQAVRSAIRRSR